jgi:hypothetical protein
MYHYIMPDEPIRGDAAVITNQIDPQLKADMDQFFAEEDAKTPPEAQKEVKSEQPAKTEAPKPVAEPTAKTSSQSSIIASYFRHQP